MKSVLILSAVTFLLIFGGVVVLALQLGDPAPQGSMEMHKEDYTAAERMLRDLQVERDRIQLEREQLTALRQSYAVQEQVLVQGQARLQEIAGQMDTRTQALSTEQEASVVRLAKMYEVMAPQKAAPILASLDLEITLEIMRRMKERQAAGVLALMDPAVAAQVSTRLSHGGQ